MKHTIKLGAKYLAPTMIIAVIFVVGFLTVRQPAVNAGPPSGVPDIDGEPFTGTIDKNIQIPQTAIEERSAEVGWVTVFDENFEEGISSPPWLNISLNGGPYMWGAESIANSLDISSTKVAWGVGTGQPELNPLTDGYPKDVNSWLVTGPFNFTNAVDGVVSFDLYLDAVPGVPGDPTKPGNTFAVAVSTDGSTYTGVQIIDGGSGEWEALQKSLADYAGKPQVWIAFIFKSDNQPNPENLIGALLDNVEVMVNYPSKVNLPFIAYGLAPTPIPPTPIPPSPTPLPNQNYRDNFTDTIEPWSARRWSNGANYTYEHRADCDEGGRCGFLEAEVKNKEAYVIISPLIQSKTYPYNIEVEARLMPKSGSDYPEDQAQYGVIFGGNWNGQPCPTSDFSSCFTQYYELRVRFRNLNGKQFLEFKVKRIDGHDANNQNFGPDLIEWTKVDANVKKFVEWDVNINSDGKIKISANNKHVGTAKTDTTYLNNRYFGVEVRTGPNNNSRVKFDYFKID